MRTRNIIRIILILFTGMIFLIGCAATNSYMEDSSASDATQGAQDNSDLDKLLGVGSDGSDENINEDDVLRLLGVNDDSKTEGSLSMPDESQSEAGMASETSGNDAGASEGQTAASAQRSAQGAAISRDNRTAPAWKSNSYVEHYQEALQEYRARRYREAIQKFEALLASNSKGNLSDNCQYWIGESYYDQGNYTQAILAFEKVFTFPNSNKDDSAQLKLGLCYVKLNDKTKAKDELQKLINNYPTSEYISIAKRFIAQLEGSSPSQ